VPTDLFAVVSGLGSEVVAAVVPPACFRPPEPPPPARGEREERTVEFAEWRPRHRARHLLPSFSALGPGDHAFRFEVSAFAEGEWSPWIGTATVGPHLLPPVATSCPVLESRVDEYVATRPVERVRLRLRLRADDVEALLRAPWLATLSASDGASAGGASGGGAVRLPVPAVSQMTAPPDVRARICSPTSVAMVLGYFGAAVDHERLAAEVFHPGLDRYGVWPAAVRAAGRHGVMGYLLRFPDWTAAAWCLDRGLPIVASVRYAAGELTDAAVPETAGHLLVLTGYEDGVVLVNDPAAPDVAGVARRYRLDELTRVWLDRTGVGYVFFRPGYR
jgi:hypothetical protein